MTQKCIFLFISLFALQIFSLVFTFFNLLLLSRLSKMPNFFFSPRPSLRSGLGKVKYTLVGRARPKTVNFFHLNFPFNSHFFLFQLFFFENPWRFSRISNLKNLLSNLDWPNLTRVVELARDFSPLFFTFHQFSLLRSPISLHQSYPKLNKSG